MKPPFAYYGGKTRLAPWIVSLMPAHRVYVEPFAGSAAVLFAKPQSPVEVLNDIDGNIVNFFRVLRSRSEDLELACRLTPYARDEYQAAGPSGDIDNVEDEIERARRWWVRSTQSFSQTGTDNTGWSISVNRSCNRAQEIHNRIGRFTELTDRLHPVFIENSDAVSVINRYGASDAVLYVDPTYLDSVRRSYSGHKRPSGDYRCEYATEADHRALAEALHSIPAAVLLSGYPSPLYDELYPTWWRHERVVRRSSNNGHAANPQQQRAVEVIWSNRPLADGAA